MGASFSIRSSSKLESISPHRGLFAETPLKLLETRRLGVAAVVNSSVADVCKFLWLAVGHARNLVEWFSGHSLRGRSLARFVARHRSLPSHARLRKMRFSSWLDAVRSGRKFGRSVRTRATRLSRVADVRIAETLETRVVPTVTVSPVGGPGAIDLFIASDSGDAITVRTDPTDSTLVKCWRTASRWLRLRRSSRRT